jgi:hypothetical protein
MPRRVYLLGLGLALVPLALAFTVSVLSLQPGVTEANARRILPGMRLAEVEAILGSHAASEVDIREPARYDIPYCASAG